MAEIDKTGTEDTAFIICWGRADTRAQLFTFKDSTGAVIDVSGSTFVLTVNSEKNPLLTTNEQFAIVGTQPGGGTDGVVSFEPAALDTDIDTTLKYYYDIEETAGSQIATRIKAVCRIVQDISK